MPKRVYEPCLPTVATKVPTGSEWLHELKHDGFRLLIHRDGDDVRLRCSHGAGTTGRADFHGSSNKPGGYDLVHSSSMPRPYSAAMMACPISNS